MARSLSDLDAEERERIVRKLLALRPSTLIAQEHELTVSQVRRVFKMHRDSRVKR